MLPLLRSRTLVAIKQSTEVGFMFHQCGVISSLVQRNLISRSNSRHRWLQLRASHYQHHSDFVQHRKGNIDRDNAYTNVLLPGALTGRCIRVSN